MAAIPAPAICTGWKLYERQLGQIKNSTEGAIYTLMNTGLGLQEVEGVVGPPSSEDYYWDSAVVSAGDGLDQVCTVVHQDTIAKSVEECEKH